MKFKLLFIITTLLPDFQKDRISVEIMCWEAFGKQHANRR